MSLALSTATSLTLPPLEGPPEQRHGLVVQAALLHHLLVPMAAQQPQVLLEAQAGPRLVQQVRLRLQDHLEAMVIVGLAVLMEVEVVVRLAVLVQGLMVVQAQVPLVELEAMPLV